MYSTFLKTALCVSMLAVTPAWATIFLPTGVAMEQVVAHPSKQIAWDGYKVLFIEDKAASDWATTKNLHVLASGATRLAAQYSVSKITGNTGALLQAYKTAQSMRAGKPYFFAGEAFARLFYAANEPKLAAYVLEKANARQFSWGMSELIHKIHGRGITQRIASNMGAHQFDLLKQRFAKQFNSSVFDVIITQGFFADYSSYGSIPGVADASAQVLAQEPQPSVEFYNSYQKTYNPHNADVAICITNKIENCQAAQQAGMVAIHFDCTKHSVMHLITDLQTVGIAVKDY